MLYGIEDIGGYSPLISRRYLETVGQFGNVNDSNGVYSPKPEFVLDRLPLLDFLNVSHILSVGELKHPDLDRIAQDSPEGPFLYRNLGRPSQAHFISHEKVFKDWESLKEALMKPGFDPKQVILWEKGAAPSESLQTAEGAAGFEIRLLRETPHHHVWQVITQQSGYFVLSDSFNYGWSATVNGKSASIWPAFGLFQAIQIQGPGSYEIYFEYSPWSFDL